MRDTSKDIFVRYQHDLKLTSITHFQIQNEMMLLALNGQTLLHIRLQNFRQTNLKIPIDLHDRIAHLHLDYNGIHGFVSTVAGENFHVNMRNGNLKPVRRIKGHVISAIGWNNEFSKDSETGFILLGTTKGNIYETNLTANGTMNYLKLLCANLSEKELSISELHIRQFADSEADYLLLICIPNRIYCLIGGADLQAATQQLTQQQIVGTVWSSVMVEQTQEAVLQSLFNFKGGSKPKYLAMCPDKENEHPPSALAIYPPINSDDEYSQPFRFAWLAADGLAVGKVDINKAKKDLSDGFEMLNVDININHRRSEGRLDYPLDICLTEYHLILLYTGRIAAISLFDRTLAFEDFYTGVPKVVGMSRDASFQLIWVFAEPQIFKYQPNEESRNVWRIFMEQNEFGKAKKIANQLRDKRPFQMIIKKEAEKFIGEKNFVAAAESLVQSDEPFEKLVLLMLKDGVGSRNGLKRFLELKLNQIHSNKERMNRDMLVLWLLEIQLAELAELRKNILVNQNEQQNEEQQQKEAEIRRLKEQLYWFINRQIVFESITDNQTAVYRMVSTHVDFDVQLYLAQRLHDQRTVIKILLMQKGYKEILDILAKETRPELLYEYAEELIAEIPKEIVELILRQEKAMNPMKLLPAFQKCLEPEQSNRSKIVESTFLFAERISPSTTPKPVLDFLINLYATFRPKELLSFLAKCVSSKFGQTPPFDVGKAIQICGEHGLIECRVHLLCMEGLFEDAVKLALTISVELAKKCAIELDEAIEQKCNESLADFDFDEKGIDLSGGGHSTRTMREMKKRVWLEIAKNMIQNGTPITQCLAILGESNGAIRIQDVLGYFQEFTKIEHFKEPLLECIKEYSTGIKNLQKEINHATEMAEELHDEIEKSRSGFMVIRAGAQCSLCNELLLQRQFVAFICRHFFHRNCLESKNRVYSEEYANLEKEERILRKEIQMANLMNSKKIGGTKGGERHGGGRRTEEMAPKKLATIRQKMRELLCGDCPLCGLRVIEEVDKPFFDSPEEYFEELKKWMPSLT